MCHDSVILDDAAKDESPVHAMEIGVLGGNNLEFVD